MRIVLTVSTHAESSSNIFKQIGKKIADLRMEVGLTQAQLAQKIGISQPLLAYYETGKRRLPIPVLLDVASVLEVTVDEILPIPRRRGPMSKVDRELAKVRHLPEKQQRIVMDMIESVASNT